MFIIPDASHPVISASSNRVKTGKGLVPISITIGDDMKTSGGRQVHIRCPVSGSPQPKITWDKDGKPLKFTKNIKTVNTTENLVILEAKKEDSGKYSCYASNAAGVATTSSRIKILRKYENPP